MSNKETLEEQIERILKNNRKDLILGIGTKQWSPAETVDEIQALIDKSVKEARIYELDRLLHFDSFNDPYTHSGDSRPSKLVRIRIRELKGEKEE